MGMFCKALAKLPSQETTAFRGIPVDVKDNYWVGRRIRWSGVTSCSGRMSAAYVYAQKEIGAGGLGTVLQLTIASGKKIAEYSQYSEEDEIVLAPYTEFVVSSKPRVRSHMVEGRPLRATVIEMVEVHGNPLFW